MVAGASAWELRFSKRAEKDAKKLAKAGFKEAAEAILDVLERNPYALPHEKLVGDLKGFYSRRINIQHRIVYDIRKKERLVVILSMWSHYE